MDNLFDVESGKNGSLLVMYNGEETVMSVSDIFDSSRFDTLRAVSYSVGGKFAANILSGFQKVIFVVGLERETAKAYVMGSLDKNLRDIVLDTPKKDFEELDDDMRDRVCSGDINVIVPRGSMLVHSKLYLMENTVTGETRCVMGSANLSERAFAGDGQYEIVLIYDNKEQYYGACLRHFSQIESKSGEYFPKEMLDRYKESKVIQIDAVNNLERIQEELQSAKESGINLKAYLNEISPDINNSMEPQMEEMRVREKIVTVVNKITKPNVKKTDLELLSGKALENGKNKAVKYIDVPVLNCEVVQELGKESYVPLHISYDSITHDYMIAEGYDGALVTTLSEPAPIERVRKQLELLNQFIDGYGKFTKNAKYGKNQNVQARIAEMFLYGFTSPFIWKFREDILRRWQKSDAEDVPVFCILAGDAESGKSAALAFLSMLIGTFGKIRHYYDYKTLKNVENGKYISRYLNNTGEMFPLLVDDIPKTFFGDVGGDELNSNCIKNTANLPGGQKPAFLGTTNAESYVTRPEINRRVYVLEVSDSFVEDRAKLSDYLLNLHKQIDGTDLFREFCSEMNKVINRYDETNDDKDVYMNRKDFLATPRKIFASLYEKCGMELPKWFPKERFRDFDVRAEELLREAWQTKPKCFTVDMAGAVVRFDVAAACDNDSFETNRENFIKAMPRKWIKGKKTFGTLTFFIQAFSEAVNIQVEKLEDERINNFRKMDVDSEINRRFEKLETREKELSLTVEQSREDKYRAELRANTAELRVKSSENELRENRKQAAAFQKGCAELFKKEQAKAKQAELLCREKEKEVENLSLANEQLENEIQKLQQTISQMKSAQNTGVFGRLFGKKR